LKFIYFVATTCGNASVGDSTVISNLDSHQTLTFSLPQLRREKNFE